MLNELMTWFKKTDGYSRQVGHQLWICINHEDLGYHKNALKVGTKAVYRLAQRGMCGNEHDLE